MWNEAARPECARAIALILLFGLAAATARGGDVEPNDAEQVAFFEKNVRPILVERCYRCHSAKSRKPRAGLYLDSRQGWMTGGDSGPAIVPGAPNESLLIEAVRYRSEDLAMPPKGKLPPEEIAILELWVARGAVDPRDGNAAPTPAGGQIDVAAERQRWPYTPARRHPPPAVRDETWASDEIDRFVLAKLEARGLAPSADADAQTLVRRIYFDVTGLPPTPEQTAAFAASWSRTPRVALEQVVDKLLGSPRFGEHWGRKWLDLARYADTNGSDFNATYFNAWRYRDYVISAFNTDKPYDEFVREQIAGDLLPASSSAERAEQTIATGFLMLGAKMLSERDKEKLRMDIVDEQIDTMGKVFMGLALGCARCHDHKFDPVPTTDYYALAGILGSTDTISGEIQKYVSDWVRRELPVPGEHRAAIGAYEQSAASLKAKIEDVKTRLAAVRKEMAATTAPVLLGIVVDDAAAKKVGKWKASTYTPRYVGVGYIHDDKKDKGQKSVTFTPDIPEAGEYEVRVAYASGGGRAEKVPVTVAHGGGQTRVIVNQVTEPRHHRLFDAIGRYRFPKGRSSHVVIGTEGTEGYVIVDAVQFIPVALLEAKNEPLEASGKKEPGPSDEQMQASALYKEQLALEEELATLERARPPPAPVALAARDSGETADCRLRIRGEANQRGDVVRRGFLRVCSSGDDVAALGKTTGSGRAELAWWLTRPDHPLTARVLVNRVWYHLIGEGIVRSVDNFGRLGEAPTHPELLDTLAADFVADGWSVKRLIRRILLSRVYRLASSSDAKASVEDPENRLLWRAHRRRLPAEAIRDTLLLISDQLDLTPSRDPVGTFEKLAVNNGTGAWSGEIDPALARKRSIYQPVVRGALQDLMTVFDFADPDVTVGRRPATTVPAQALFLMNSPFVRACAERAAARLSRDEGGVVRAFLLCYGRAPTASELRRALDYIETEVAAGVAEGVANDDHVDAVWARFVQALFGSTEFRTLD